MMVASVPGNGETFLLSGFPGSKHNWWRLDPKNLGGMLRNSSVSDIRAPSNKWRDFNGNMEALCHQVGLDRACYFLVLSTVTKFSPLKVAWWETLTFSVISRY